MKFKKKPVKNIIIILLAILILTSCATQKESSKENQQSKVEKEYYLQLEHVNALLLKHQGLGNQINNNSDPEEHKKNLDEYLLWLEKNKKELETFKTFIESNYKSLKNVKPSQVALRDTIKLTLEDIEKNQDDFQTYNRIWDRYH